MVLVAVVVTNVVADGGVFVVPVEWFVLISPWAKVPSVAASLSVVAKVFVLLLFLPSLSVFAHFVFPISVVRDAKEMWNLSSSPRKSLWMARMKQLTRWSF